MNKNIQATTSLTITGFELEDFAKRCLVTTSNWSIQRMNDRIYLRRPFIYQLTAGRIDRLLNQHLPQYFQQIRIE